MRYILGLGLCDILLLLPYVQTLRVFTGACNCHKSSQTIVWLFGSDLISPPFSLKCIARTFLCVCGLMICPAKYKAGSEELRCLPTNLAYISPVHAGKSLNVLNACFNPNKAWRLLIWNNDMVKLWMKLWMKLSQYRQSYSGGISSSEAISGRKLY